MAPSHLRLIRERLGLYDFAKFKMNTHTVCVDGLKSSDLIEKGNISIEEKDIAFRRFAMLVKQLKYAHDSLKETYFTNTGENIFNYYANKVNNELL